MKPNATLKEILFRGWISPIFSQFILFGIIVLLLFLGFGDQILGLFSPKVYLWAEQLGLTDIRGSIWFIFIPLIAVLQYGTRIGLRLRQEEKNFSLVFKVLMVISGLSICTGLVLSLGGYYGESWVAEGKSAKHFRFEDRIPPGWTNQIVHGKSTEYYSPPFVLKNLGFSLERGEFLNRFAVKMKGSQIEERFLTYGEPIKFPSFSIYLGDFRKLDDLGVVLEISDENASETRVLHKIRVGEAVKLPDLNIRVLDIILPFDAKGAGARIEYREKNWNPEVFWVFSKASGLNQSRDRKRAYTVKVRNVEKVYESEILYTQTRGERWVSFGVWGFLFSLISLFILRVIHRRRLR